MKQNKKAVETNASEKPSLPVSEESNPIPSEPAARSNTWIFVMMVAAVVVGAAAILVLLFLRKRK